VFKLLFSGRGIGLSVSLGIKKINDGRNFTGIGHGRGLNSHEFTVQTI